jgi:hypothetical protein
MARRKAADNQVRVGNVTRVSERVTIAGGDVMKAIPLSKSHFS